MLRNILRSSRCLARRQINKVLPSLRPRYSPVIQFDCVRDSPIRSFSATTSNPQVGDIEPAVFEEICNETLESLCEYFEELVESSSKLKSADITFSDGVLTVFLGTPYGTYVINRQSPNKQIWLSSPVSGPKRYDLILDHGGYWIYKHDNKTLHTLLQEELAKLIDSKVDFKSCAHSLI